MKTWMLVPLIAAILVLGLFAAGIGRKDAQVLPSALIDREVPPFELAGLDGGQGLAASDLAGGGVKLLNVWASWCVPCRQEHPALVDLAESGIPIHGLNYKDAPEDATAFLAELGNPYTRIGADRTGRTGIEFGVYGVPETFVIDGEGRIRYRHVGPILDRNIETLRDAIEKAGE